MNTQDLHTDKDLIEKCRKGDRKAQYEFYSVYSKAMYNTCLRFMNSRTEAEDMLQEAFTEAFLRMESFRFESTPGAWLKRIVINKCINELHRRKTDLAYLDDLEPFSSMAEEEEPAYMEGITVDRVLHAMEKLPKGSRLIFSLYLLEGYDHQEISQILKISESNSKSQYMRAKQKIKSLLTTMHHAN